MDQQELKNKVIQLLCEVAPDLEGTITKTDVDLRRFYDLDSVDFLAFVVKLHDEFHIEIPETDYSHLHTIDKATNYLLLILKKPDS